MNPKLYFAFRQRRKLSGKDVFENPFAPWTIDDLYPWLDMDDDWEPAGLFEFMFEPEVEKWLDAAERSYWPVFFLIEQCCHDGELLDLQLRESRLRPFPLESIQACEATIASAPAQIADDLFRVIWQAVRIERARRRGKP